MTVNIAVGCVVFGDANRSHDRVGGGCIAKIKQKTNFNFSSRIKENIDRHELVFK